MWSKFEQNGKTVHNSCKFLFDRVIYPQAINRQCGMIFYWSVGRAGFWITCTRHLQ